MHNADHPRSRGENEQIVNALCSASGSSPLTRGKQLRRLYGLKSSGIIPAHAGKTRRELFHGGHEVGSSPLTRGKPTTSMAQRLPPRDHPRSRGENLIGGCLIAPGQGSSPLTRGKLMAMVRPPSRRGIIPAHAGKTRPTRRGAPRSRDHPRSRGENQESEGPVSAKKGSSPLTRGKPYGGCGPADLCGIIPAHAGKTLPDLRFYRADRSDLGKP